MAIYKARMETQFVTIPNSTAQDKRLSFEARGMLAMILSMPEDWEINKEWLMNQSTAGRDKVQRIINELVEHGYMTKQQPKNQRGQFTSNDFFVYPSPVDGFSVNGLTVDGKTPTTKETDLQKKQNTKDHGLSDDKPSKEKIEYPEWFEWIWKHKPEREGANPKRKAFSACNARIRQGATVRELCEGLQRYGKYCVERKIIFTPNVQQLATFYGAGESYKEKWEVYESQKGQSIKSAETLRREREGLEFDERMAGKQDRGFSLIGGRYWINSIHYYSWKDCKESEFIAGLHNSEQQLSALEKANAELQEVNNGSK